MKSTIRFRVRYQETDKMGIVHHSVYYVWYEMGRTEWMRMHNLTYKECEEKGWLLPLVSSGTQYQQAAYYDDLIQIETIMTLEKGITFRFDYTVRNVASDQILAVGYTTHVCVNKDFKIDKEATRSLKKIFSNN